MNWHITRDGFGISTVKNRMNPDVAKVIDTGLESEMLANARLIAAAPQMLAALEKVSEEMEAASVYAATPIINMELADIIQNALDAAKI